MELRVELALRHKMGLTLPTPILLGSGAAGLGVLSPLIDASALGGLVTLPVCAKSHELPPQISFALVPGGIVHVPAPVLSARALLRTASKHWQRAGIPIIVHLYGEDPDGWATCAATLEESPQIHALECRVDTLAPEAASRAVARLRSASMKPILVQVPLHAAVDYCEALGDGADAFVIGAPPSATAWSDEGAWVHGELHGVGVLPLVLRALHDLRDLAVPLVALGGIHAPEHAVQAILAGATAIMLDTATFRRLDLPTAALDAIMREMSDRGLENIRELVGRELR